ncbi:UbiA prenyltransferase family protein [Streptomyces sp. NBC_00388]|uniref:UbiA prenyltransferase family protein n=1 Tax=Streptomyces sp. NBC_00388 TaxID=2975735 RepID=UPI002E2374F0
MALPGPLLDIEPALSRSAPSPPGRTRDLFVLIRPGQWSKNLAVVPLALADSPAWNVRLLGQAALAVVAFTLASSLVYLLNDIFDRDRDRLHPTKRLRPIADGRVSIRAATGFGAVLAVLLAAVLQTDPLAHWWPLAAYLVINIAYSKGLKNVPLVDVFVVALGFLLRLVQGYLVMDHDVSSWLALSVLSLCLLLTLGKRRHEMAVGGEVHRPALRGYSLTFLDQLLGLTTVFAAVSYVLYIYLDAPVGDSGPLLTLLSAPFALFGLARNLQVLLVEDGGGEPVRTLFHDRIMVINSALWGALIGTALVLAHTGS